MLVSVNSRPNFIVDSSLMVLCWSLHHNIHICSLHSVIGQLRVILKRTVISD